MLKGFRGREALMGALESYLRRSRLSPCQPLLDLHLSLYGAQLEDSGLTRFEIASALGSFSNIVPVTFWTIFHIFSDVDLLAQIREEIWNVTCTVTSDAGVSTNRIDLRRLQSETVLFSAITEVLRYRATGVGIRYVTEDVHLENEENSYYLRKGAWLAIVNRGLHFDEEAWGADAKYFVANRFQGKTPHLSFRGFGSGVSTCCGKSFALHQIASFVAVLVMRYEIDPVDGIWKEPGQERRNTVAQVASPATEVAVRMRSREGMTGVNWQFSY
jgi:cytochrome P450